MAHAVDPSSAVLMRAEVRLTPRSPNGRHLGMAADWHDKVPRRVRHRNVRTERGAKRCVRGSGRSMFWPSDQRPASLRSETSPHDLAHPAPTYRGTPPPRDHVHRMASREFRQIVQENYGALTQRNKSHNVGTIAALKIRFCDVKPNRRTVGAAHCATRGKIHDEPIQATPAGSCAAAFTEH